MRRSAGFSLIEVMIAMLILGVALVGLTQGITAALSSGKESEVQTTAVLLASGRLEKLRADGEIKDGVVEGDWGDSFPNYRWRRTITSTETTGLHDVEVVVESAQSGQRILALRTMLFEPYVTAEMEERSKTGKKGRERR
jgi:general secretion pathway protein I